MAFDWALFLSDEFHPTFQKELSKQLFEKGSIGTGFKNFEELDFQIIIGMHDSEIKQVENKMFAKIDFITPGSFSIPVEIYWTTEDSSNFSKIHKNDISNMNIEFNWGENFPFDEILPWMMVDPE